MKFIVEVPTYFRVEVDAPDADDAARAAEYLVGMAEPSDLSLIVAGYGHVTRTALVPLGPGEDNDPDVYLCRGGKLSLIDSAGQFVDTAEGCT